MTGYVGSLVSLDCGDVLGTYQGMVTDVNNELQTLSISCAFRNGVQCKVPVITINAGDIRNLQILKPKTDVVHKPVVRPIHKSLSQTGLDTASPTITPSPHPSCDGQAPQVAPMYNIPKNNGTVQRNNNTGMPAGGIRKDMSPHNNTTTSRNGLNTMVRRQASPQIYNNYRTASPTKTGKQHRNQQSPNTVQNNHRTVQSSAVNNRRTPTAGYHSNHLDVESGADVLHSTLYGDGRKRTPSTTPRKMAAAGAGGDTSHPGHPRQRAPGAQRSHSFSTTSTSEVYREIYLNNKKGQEEEFVDDFDFEGNLALFDKNAVFQEIESTGQSLVGQVDEFNHIEKYRCDENILDSGPVVYHQIVIPPSAAGTTEYVTDSGVVVPSITAQMRGQLMSAAEDRGLSTARQMEMLGRSASEMVLQLIGGGHRLGPKNAHQLPCVVVLGGDHAQGAAGMNCARQLACHNVNVIMFFEETPRTVLNRVVFEELCLLRISGAKIIGDVKYLPSRPIDLIVNSLDSHDKSFMIKSYADLAQWANDNKAGTLTLDPPIDASSIIQTEWSLGIALPLAMDEACGKPYLCDIGIPPLIYKESGIKYKSPFGHKFYIPLHQSNKN